VVRSLATHALQRWEKAQRRLLFGLAGCPGSGKSTLAAAVVAELNERSGLPDFAALLPMDGFHLSREQLDALPDPKTAHFRRGAPFTFDAQAFVTTVRSVRAGQAISAPGFDHAVGDPVPGAVQVAESACLVVVEGNYLCLPHAPWSELPSLLDETWFVDVTPAIAMERIVQRHMRVWNISREAALVRASSDLLNAQLVWDTKPTTQGIVLVPNQTRA